MVKYKKSRAQSAIEYAGVIILIFLALYATAVYLKRSIQGKIGNAADVYGGGLQYDN